MSPRARVVCIVSIFLGLSIGATLWGTIGGASVEQPPRAAVAGSASRPDTNLHLHAAVSTGPSDPVTVGSILLPVPDQPFSTTSPDLSTAVPLSPPARVSSFASLLSGLRDTADDSPVICYPANAR